MDPAGVQKVDASEIFGFSLYLDGIFGTKYPSFTNQTFAVSSAEAFTERDQKLLVTSCGSAQNGHARCLTRKNYIEIEGIISGCPMSSSIRFEEILISTYFGSSACFFPADSGERYHAIMVYGASFQRPLGSVASFQLHYPRMIHDGNLIQPKRASCTPSFRAWAEFERTNSKKNEQVSHKVCRNARLLRC